MKSSRGTNAVHTYCDHRLNCEGSAGQRRINKWKGIKIRMVSRAERESDGDRRARARREIEVDAATPPTDKDQCHCKLYAVFMYAFANEMFIHRVKLRRRGRVLASRSSLPLGW